MLNKFKTLSLSNFLWDCFCTFSLVGIWPRFIEPNLLFLSKYSIPIPHLHKDLHHLKLLQISDLHLYPQVSSRFLEKLIKKIERLKPDLIFFTGDFLCYGQMPDPLRLRHFLQRLHAPYGCFAILGNHDYAECVSINSDGEYDVIRPPGSSLKKAFSRLVKTVKLRKVVTERAKKVPLHEGLINLLKDTPFQLLHNQTKTISINGAKLNICGLGEYMLGRLNADEAFKTYQKEHPGIILLHNPDGAPLLKKYPGNIILSGHTHGGQVNLPWMWKKFTLLENMSYKNGLKRIDHRYLYVNRGVGSLLPFRWFAPPEILLMTLEPSHDPN